MLNDWIASGFARLTAAVNAVDSKTRRLGGVVYVDCGSTPILSKVHYVYCDLPEFEQQMVILSPHIGGTASNDSDEHIYGEYSLKVVKTSSLGFDLEIASTNRYGLTGRYAISWAIVIFPVPPP